MEDNKEDNNIEKEDFDNNNDIGDNNIDFSYIEKENDIWFCSRKKEKEYI